MGKSGHAVGAAAAKADPKAKAKAAAGSEKDKLVTKGKDKEKEKEVTKVDPQVEAAAKLLEEATQKFADDQRDEHVRFQLREENRKAGSERGPLKGNRDKGIARVQKFQNKLKLFKGDVDLPSVLSDIDGVDASKYVVELADCILEAAGVNVKLKELFSCVKVCSRLYATYEEFGPLLLKSLDKAYKATPATDLNRRRFLVRLCVELFLVECVPTSNQPLLDMVKELCDISVAEEQVVTNFTIIVSVVQKHAFSCLNLTPSKQKAYEEALGSPWVERKCVLSDALRNQMQQLIVNAYQGSAGGLLQSAHTRLLDQEKVNAKLRIDKGQVDAENDMKHQTLKESYAKLQSCFQSLSETLNQPLPSPQEENPEATRLTGAPRREMPESKEERLLDIWEDSEQQRFYEEILDCKDVIPAVLLGVDKAVAPVEVVKKEDGPTPEGAKAQLAASDFELYLARVSKAEGAKQVDDLVQEFFHLHNTKGNRRALAQTLYDCFKCQPHSLAQRSRLIATVAPYMKEVPVYVVAGLQKDLDQIIAEKDPERLEGKIKTLRYLCELCKFRICPPGVILDTFKALCDDFSQHHAQLIANLLQCCGRFLLYTPETATRTENLLERMMRLKNSKSLPLGLEIMLEDAYYQIKPPEGKRQKVKDKEPLKLFTQHLIYERLYDAEEDDDKVLRLIRKLPWGDKASKWVKKCILELNLHANYEGIHQLASLLSGLAKYRDYFVIDCIDSLLENIQAGLERNDFQEAPLRVRQVKLLGELYNYRLVDSNIVFDMMYHLIGFGGPTMHKSGNAVTAHKVLERSLAARRGSLGGISEEAPGGEDGVGSVLPPSLVEPMHPAEPPYDYFRIKLVCVLLETCGHYFDRGQAKQKLDRFIQFFMRYVLTKGELPLRINYMVNDMMERIRPRYVLPTELPKLDAQILKMLKAERETLDLGEDAEGKSDEEVDEDGSSSGDESSSNTSSSSEDSESESSESESDEEDQAQRDRDYNRGAEESTKRHEEDDEFDKEIQQMLIDGLEREKNAPRVLADLPMPVTAAAKKAEGDQPAPGMFSLMQKRPGGKVLVKQIDIPEHSKLVRVAQKSTEEGSKEKDEIKRYIIQYDQMNAVAGAMGSAFPPMGVAAGMAGSSRSGIQVHIRQGQSKGAKMSTKGAGKSKAKGRHDEDYLKESFLPEDKEVEPSFIMPMHQGPTLRNRLAVDIHGSGGSNTKGGGGAGDKGGGHKSSGGGKGRPVGRGTPGHASHRQAL